LFHFWNRNDLATEKTWPHLPYLLKKTKIVVWHKFCVIVLLVGFTVIDVTVSTSCKRGKIMVKKMVMLVTLAVLLPLLPVGPAQADIIALYGPASLGQDYPNISMATQEIIDAGLHGNAGWSGYWNGWPNWSFNPPNLDYVAENNGLKSSTSLSSGVTYPGSSLHASGTGSASSNNPESTASSGFSIVFTPAVNCKYTLTGIAVGDGAGVSLTEWAYGYGTPKVLLSSTTEGFTGSFNLHDQILSAGKQYTL
jgi:hypothetical protein